MSCSAHVHIELRVNGKWEHYSTHGMVQDYAIFDAMAGVRHEVDAIVEPKGVPDDMSVVTVLDWAKWKQDAHHASWFNEEEIDLLSSWLYQQGENDYYDLENSVLKGSWLFGTRLTAFKHYSDSKLPEGCDAVRLVFWFDC